MTSDRILKIIAVVLIIVGTVLWEVGCYGCDKNDKERIIGKIVLGAVVLLVGVSEYIRIKRPSRTK